jgi:hypothetical protein
MAVDNSTVQFSRVPANFSFIGNLNVFGECASFICTGQMTVGSGVGMKRIGWTPRET